jgi:hypothetical protein
MEKLNEQTVSSSHTEKSEVVTGEAERKVSYGKFKDLDALLSAYNSLEAEFTKRSQRLKELESKSVAPLDKQENDSVTENHDSTPTETEEEKEKRIIGDYIKSLISSKPKTVVLSGGMATSTPQKRPKSVTEAGLLAKEIFNKD